MAYVKGGGVYGVDDRWGLSEGWGRGLLEGVVGGF